MGRQKILDVDFKCKKCKFRIELRGTKESISANINLLMENHKKFSLDCDAKYDDFVAEKLDSHNEYLIQAKRLIEDAQKNTEKILSQVNWELSDIVGNEEAKGIFEERLIDHIKYKDRLLKLKLYNECGIILAGIQGTGKTYLVKTVIHNKIFSNSEYSKKFDIFIMRASDFVLGNIGSTAKMISAIMEIIRKSNKDNEKETILIIDEIDSLLPKRKTDRISSKEKMSSILDEFGGIHDDHTVLVIGMTNLPDDIDAHALATGRFGSPLLINIPTSEERYEMFLNFSKGIEYEKVKGIPYKSIIYEKAVNSEFVNTVLDKFSGRDIRIFVKDLHILYMKKHERGEHNSDVTITCGEIEELFERKYSTVKSRNIEMLNELAKYYNRYEKDVEGSQTFDDKNLAVNTFKAIWLDVFNAETDSFEFTEDVYNKYNDWKGTGYVHMKKGMFTKIITSDSRIKMGRPVGKDGKQHDAYYNVRLKVPSASKDIINSILKE